jgi:transcription elongation factor GreA
MGTKEEVVYELVIPDAVELEDGHISVSSPLGSAFLDRKAKDSVSVALPAGTRKFKILKVETLHDLTKETVGE